MDDLRRSCFKILGSVFSSVGNDKQRFISELTVLSIDTERHLGNLRYLLNQILSYCVQNRDLSMTFLIDKLFNWPFEVQCIAIQGFELRPKCLDNDTFQKVMNYGFIMLSSFSSENFKLNPHRLLSFLRGLLLTRAIFQEDASTFS